MSESHRPFGRADSRWWLSVLLLGAALVSVLTILSPILGVIWAALLLGYGAGRAFHLSHPGPRPEGEPARIEDGRHRVLVLANQTVANSSLWTEIQGRCAGRRGEILVVAPALTDSRAALWASDLDAAVENAKQRLELSLEAAGDTSLDARGQIGDSDPNVALRDALRTFPADEIVIWTHTPDRSPWLERGVVQRARLEIGLPVTHVVVDPEGWGPAPGP
jgi:hypothetical protein